MRNAPHPNRATPRRAAPLPGALLAALLALLLAACVDPAVNGPDPDATPAPTPERLAVHLGAPAGAESDFAVPFGAARTLSFDLTWPTDYEGEVELSIAAEALPAGVSLSATGATVARADLPWRVEVAATESVSAQVLASEFDLSVSAATVHATPSGEIEAATLALTGAVRALVTSAADDGPGSLRHLVEAVPHDGAHPVAITFDPEAFAAPTTITLAQRIVIGASLTVRGPTDATGAPLVTLDGAGASERLFSVDDGLDVTLDSLALTGATEHAIFNLGDLTLENSIVTGNGSYEAGSGWSAGTGAGIHTALGELTVRASRVTGNTARQGGGIYAHSGAVTIVGSFIEENRAYEGGGISVAVDADVGLERTYLRENEAEWTGGGVDSRGHLVLVHSTIEANTAQNGAGIHVWSTGSLAVNGSLLHKNVAAINGGGLFANGPASLLNSTVAHNRALRGGGIFSSTGTDAWAQLFFTTVAWNSAEQNGGGIYAGRSVELRAAIVAGNRVGAAGAAAFGPDVYGAQPVTSLGYNLVRNVADANLTGAEMATDIYGEDPYIVLNPGVYDPAKPHVLSFYRAADSPAVDAVPLEECVDATGDRLLTDQVGGPRPGAKSADDRCDIGAFEVSWG